MNKLASRTVLITFIVLSTLLFLLIFKTWQDIQPIKKKLQSVLSDIQTLQITDRYGYPLTISYQNRWNIYDHLPLYQIPDFLKNAFLTSEDQNYNHHHGVDWRARIAAIVQNLTTNRSSSIRRGASTITEQVVRILQPRPRTLWAKWIEGFEAADLERHYHKADIFEFYLNQIPYANHRRGVLQAARYYFDRDLSTLTQKEMLALVVLARAPSGYDLYRHPERIEKRVKQLAQVLYRHKQMSLPELEQIDKQPFQLKSPAQPIQASHFARYVRLHSDLHPLNSAHSLTTTLDGILQTNVQKILNERVRYLRPLGVRHAAALVVDHKTGEILAWVVANSNPTSSISNKNLVQSSGEQIDSVTTARQPGSALKPFLYALALEKGWTPITMISDSPYSEAIGTGWHHFKNYSGRYYGNVTLREALGNSLNIPALHTIRYVGTKHYLHRLHDLGFISLNRGVEIYDEGLALGNGEVTLLELVQGYATLANQGVFRPLRFLRDPISSIQSRRVFSAEVSSLIANILADPKARLLEFGEHSVLNLPVQTAVKTGTSTDYRDAWTVGFNDRYVVGIWMGNLDYTPMNGVTGVIGPALALRAIFAQLNQQRQTAPLYLSPKLIQKNVCLNRLSIALNSTKAEIPLQENEDLNRIKTLSFESNPREFQSNPNCFPIHEYFIYPTDDLTSENSMNFEENSLKFIFPTPGVQVAIDPRIPKTSQGLKFQLGGVASGSQIEWWLNGKFIGLSHAPSYLWKLQPGKYELSAIVRNQKKSIFVSPVMFRVKP